MTTVPPSEIIGSDETATLLGCTRSALARKVRDGEVVPFKKMPGAKGAHLFLRSVIEDMARAKLDVDRAALAEREALLAPDAA